jgi:peptidoglycan-associated lipoprotein
MRAGDEDEDNDEEDEMTVNSLSHSHACNHLLTFLSMLRLSPRLLFLLLPVLALTFSSCVNKNKGDGAYGAGGGSDSDYVSGSALPDRQEGVSFMGSNVDRNRFEPVYFEFDSSEIRSSDRGRIREIADFQRSSGKTIIIAGFTDERGTPEYNRGLGERRALTVRSALMADGADGGSLQTVSFGAEMPADGGTSETAYARNRRAEFGVVR